MSQAQSTLLVTGGAGYIGSHTVQILQNKGYRVVILDNLTCGHQDFVETLQAELIVGNVGDRTLLDQIFATYPISAVVHFAAFAYVGESIVEPAKYYRNNVAVTLTLLEAMVAASVTNLVFSSTCATYGVPQTIPILEGDPQHPINPYGASKLAVERMLADFEQAYGLKSVIFRFFNAAGADPAGRLGEDHNSEPHLIPLVLLTALGQRNSLSIFGTDYPTADGTCIRDYIHVCDLAQAHVLGLEYLLRESRSEVFNLGNGSGFSVRQLIEVAKTVTKKTIPVEQCDRRLGDPPILVASSEKAKRILGWQPQYQELQEILSHAWAWHQQRHGAKEPLVSVIIPAYNAESFIERTLESVLNQTYRNIEVIVSDDGSEDRTANIVRSLAKQDQRLILVQQQNAGVAAARNLGIEKSTGELIAPIDADDIWHPQNLEKQVQCLRQDASVGLVYSWSVDIDKQDSLTGEFRAANIEGNVYKTLICHNFIGNSSASLFRRDCIERVGAYNCQLKAQNAQGCEDWDLYLRIAEHYQFRVVPEFLIGYRKFSGSMSGDYLSMAKSQSLMLQDVQRRHSEISPILFRLSCSSFYVYLARQSSQSGNHKSTLFWLSEALKIDYITPLWRYGFYVLLLKSLVNLFTPLGLLKLNGFSTHRQQSAQSSSGGFKQAQKSLEADLKPRRGSIGFKLLVGNLLHRLLLML